jgi:methyl coenzyme M reductase subunit C
MMRLTTDAHGVPGGVIVVDAGAGVPADTRVATAAAWPPTSRILH